jgi:hypothetical protein
LFVSRHSCSFKLLANSVSEYLSEYLSEYPTVHVVERKDGKVPSCPPDTILRHSRSSLTLLEPFSQQGYRETTRSIVKNRKQKNKRAIEYSDLGYSYAEDSDRNTDPADRYQSDSDSDLSCASFPELRALSDEESIQSFDDDEDTTTNTGSLQSDFDDSTSECSTSLSNSYLRLHLRHR